MLKVTFGLNNESNLNDINLFHNKVDDIEAGDFVLVDYEGEERIGLVMGISKDKVNTHNEVKCRASYGDVLDYWNDAEYNLIDGKLEVTDQVIDYYRKNFNGCQNLCEDVIKKKLARNIILSIGFGKDVVRVNGHRHLYRYGSMVIRMSGCRVTGLDKKPLSGFKKNKRKYKYLNEVLELKGK